MINNMELGQKPGLMGQNMKETMRMVLKMVLEGYNIRMDHTIVDRQ